MDASLISLAGVLGALLGSVLVAIITTKHQKNMTTKLIESELHKINTQILGESRARLLAKKEDWLTDAITELLTETDPELQAEFNYKKIVSLIHRIQLILDTRSTSQNLINRYTSEIGFAIRTIVERRSPPTPLLSLQGELMNATRAFLHGEP